MPYMYILQCADDSYYVGSTWNLEKRLWQHNQGLGAKYTARRLPVTERVSSQVLCLPFYSEMTEAMLDGMCKAIERIQRYSQEVKTCLRA